jgi:hypothetical protein
MNTQLSSAFQRIGTQLLTADDPSLVVISEVDAEFLSASLYPYALTKIDYRLLCVMYTHATRANELSLPTGIMPAYQYLAWAYGEDAYASQRHVALYAHRDIVACHGSSRNTRYVPAERRSREIFFEFIALAPEIMSYIARIDIEGLPAQKLAAPAEQPEPFVITYAGESNDKDAEGANTELEMMMDPDDCPVYVFCDKTDNYRLSEFNELMPIMKAMTSEALREVNELVDELFSEGLGTKEGRMLTRAHPLLKYSYHDRGIATSRLYEMQVMIDQELYERGIGAVEFHASDNAESDTTIVPQALIGSGHVFTLEPKPESKWDTEEWSRITLATVLRVGRSMQETDSVRPFRMHPNDAEIVDTLFGSLEVTPEHHALICSAVYRSTHGPIVRGIMTLPTAREILGDVFPASMLQNNLKMIWSLTLNGILDRAEPSGSVTESSNEEHDPLQDHYVVSDTFLGLIPPFDAASDGAVRPLPVKHRVVCDMQIGYDRATGLPIRISQPYELLTRQEWQHLMFELSAYNPDTLLTMAKELQRVWHTYSNTNVLTADLGQHPLYRMAFVNGEIVPFRIYVILNTIVYAYELRTRPMWPFVTPDEEFVKRGASGTN